MSAMLHYWLCDGYLSRASEAFSSQGQLSGDGLADPEPEARGPIPVVAGLDAALRFHLNGQSLTRQSS